MSVLQLTSGRILQTASADGPECVKAVPEGRAKDIDCANCSDGACPGDWRRTFRYNICSGPTNTGYYKCEPSTWKKKKVGRIGDCVEKYSYLAIATCIAGEMATGAATVVTGCALGCSPYLAAGPAGPGLFTTCMGICTGYAGWGAAAYGAKGMSPCIFKCSSISRCVPGPEEDAFEADLELANVCSSGG